MYLQLPKKMMNKDIPLLPKLYFTICDVRDVAAAHVSAMAVPEAAGIGNLDINKITNIPFI